ncbi:MAG: 16S rRNA (uracil(1498)-N(3))-methyltransferase [Pseudomonadota bacterium]
MNLILLEATDFTAPDTVTLVGRRLQHVLAVHRASVGDTLRVGQINGLMGDGVITALDAEMLQLNVSLTLPPPAKQPVTLLLALPRPKMLKRTLQMITTLGVERVVLLNSYRVEKSFWQSPWLTDAAIREQLVLGLEQARDTVLPEVLLAQRFKPFVEDQLPALLAGRRGWLAHPGGGFAGPDAVREPQLLAIGPEGGFIPYEVEMLQRVGLQSIDLGPRILRVETAVAVALAKLLPLI